MKRVNVYLNGTSTNGKVLPVGNSTDEFFCSIKLALNISPKNLRFFIENGCEITDLTLIKDDEVVYVSDGGDFISIDPDKDEGLPDLSACSFESGNVKHLSDWITLNVGGKYFTTSRSTLTTKEPSSMLARMFTETNGGYLINPSFKDSSGAYLIDRSSLYFEPIINYLRHGEIILDKNINPKGVLEEAKFYGVESMISQLNSIIKDSESSIGDNASLTRKDVIHSLITTPYASKLRFQGVNLSGADLNKLDLRYINFKFACLSKCNLSGADLSHCCLDRADLSYTNLEGAQLLAVKARCANMEGANLKGCNLEDPSGSFAMMEGVNLKGANMEGSNMAGVILRVATLKNANLQNCNLRAAILAGADLENCNLSGSDLHEANLRGANLKDAAFELMLTPLHMSQTVR